jgi:hypothetical protein
MHVNDLPDNGKYIVKLAPDCWILPLSSGKALKTRWKSPDIQKYKSDQSIPNGYGLVQVSEGLWIAVRPVRGSRTPELQTEMGKAPAVVEQKSLGTVEVPISRHHRTGKLIQQKPSPPKVIPVDGEPDEVIIED